MVFNLWVLGVRFFAGGVKIVRILTAVSFLEIQLLIVIQLYENQVSIMYFT